MSKLLEGKSSVFLGVWNKWSIAQAIAQAFVREGATLLLTYQNDRAKPTVEELGKELGAKAFFPCDVQQQSDIDSLATAVKAQGHRPAVVVHCLGFYNIIGVAKAALEASVKYLASELGKNKIRVNAISAGPIKTFSARGIKDFSKVLEFVAQHAPLRRNTDIAEVADTAVFLASDLGRGVTGNTIYVDAGFQIMALDPPS